MRADPRFSRGIRPPQDVQSSGLALPDQDTSTRLDFRGRPVNGETALLLCVIDQAYDRRSWHGPNLRGSVRGLDVGVALWRPAPGRHNVWEHVVHAAYWKYVVRRRLVGARRGSFPLTGSNWFERPEEATPAAWKADLAILDDEHRQLRA